MISQKQVLKIVKEVAEANQLPPYVVEEVLNNQFRCLKDWISSGKMETIMLPNWGKYIASKSKIEKAKIKRDEKRQSLTLQQDENKTLS